MKTMPTQRESNGSGVHLASFAVSAIAALFLVACREGLTIQLRDAGTTSMPTDSRPSPDIDLVSDVGRPDAGVDSEPAYRSGACIGATSNRAVGFDDTTLGYSGRQVAERFAENGPGMLRWFDGTVTVLHLSADTSQATVTVWDSPPYQGHCYRFMNIDNVTFTVTTEDGRLNATKVGELTADDAGAGLVSVWPTLALALSENRGSLQVPADWILAEQNQWGLGFVINSRGNLESPYCLVGEPRDETPTSDCTAQAGKIVYSGLRNDKTGIGSLVQQLAGQWTWQ
jgi:hypothetical protein